MKWCVASASRDLGKVGSASQLSQFGAAHKEFEYPLITERHRSLMHLQVQ
jgi:hypothetical protein